MTVRVRLFWAVLLALVAGLGTHSYLTGLRQEVTIVIAATDIPRHAVLTADMLTEVRVHAGSRGALAPSGVARKELVVGALAVQEIPRGEPVRNDPRWLSREEGAIEAAKKGRLSYFIPKEARAITLVVDSQGLVAGKVKEGDRVDILYTSRDDSTGGVYAAMLLQQVRVLGVDGSGGSYQVTLLVTPEQALDLTLAKRRGTIDLALNPTLPNTVNLPPASPLKFLKMGQSQ